LAIAGYIFLALIAISFLNRIISYRRLSHIPGPTIAGWSRLWMVRANTSGRNHTFLYDAILKYGSLVRIGPNHLLTSDPELIRRMQAPRSPYRRSIWYTTFRFKPRADNIISVVDEDVHNELRRKMGNGYSGKEVPHMEEKIDGQVQIWIDNIRKKYISTRTELKPMDLARSVQYFTLDVISDLAFNSPFGDVPQDKDVHGYIKTTEDAIGFMTLLSIFPKVHRWIEQSRLVDLLAPTAKDKTGLGRIVGIAQAEIAKRFEGKVLNPKEDKQDMLGSFLRHGLSQEEAESETVLQIMAGSDTSATVIRVVFLYLITSPHMMSKLRAELDAGIKSGQISSPISDTEARKLPYLQACIKEAIRLWPPVTGILQKVVPPEGDTFNGTYIPGGTFIGQCAWALGRNPDIYGPDFSLFRPERWLEATGEKLQKMERQADLTFGYGRFACLGKPVAQMELNKVFVEILRSFDISIVDPSQPWDNDSRGIFLMKNFWVRVTERGSDS
ncbi:cytochrome P450, partial [Tothia fuscella]